MNRTGDDYPALTVEFDPPFIVRDVERDRGGDKEKAHDTENSSKTRTEDRHVRPASTKSGAKCLAQGWLGSISPNPVELKFALARASNYIDHNQGKRDSKTEKKALVTVLSNVPKENIEERYLINCELGRGEFVVTFPCIDQGSRKLLTCYGISKQKLRTSIEACAAAGDDHEHRELDFLQRKEKQMASRQAKEERAEEAARIAASELRDVNRDREREREYGAGGERVAAFDALDQPQQQRPGMIGSVLRAVHDTYEHAKEVVVGKSHDAAETGREGAEYTADRSREGYDATTGKAKEYKDYTTEKAKETTDSAAQKVQEKTGEAAEKAKETKESAKGKLGEYKDYAAEKARETKDSTLGKAAEYKDYTAQKAEEAKEKTKQKAGEYKDYTAQKAEEAKEKTKQKAGEYKDYAAQKAEEAKEKTRETKDAALGKAGEYKDYAAEKAKQTKDYTAEKAKEGKDTTAGKLGELKDSAADAARRAMDMLSGKKEETKEKTYETLESAQEKLRETEEEARRKMEELKVKEREYEDDAARRARENREAWEKEGDRSNIIPIYKGKEERGGILGAIGSVTGAIKEKLTQPGNKKDESSMAGRGEGEGRDRDQRAEAEKVVEVYVEDTPPGAIASTLKAADQMSGQTFNDVGRIDDEGVVRITDRHGKM
ncbi:late embryogenesis abundant protein ECP63 [Eucalyptus grandis]|uniref:late embryogenesis abundant protein ECP63 n=1 Tax=Eucalyptus grandis TaxID=71139 RepID=UPI00192EC0EC|nr:late embryogenesis abundant protein ECP63 [Eucalyptus grandis]